MPRSKKTGVTWAKTRRNPFNLATLKLIRSGKVLLALLSGPTAHHTHWSHTNNKKILAWMMIIHTGEKRTETADGEKIIVGGGKLFEIGFVVKFSQFRVIDDVPGIQGRRGCPAVGFGYEMKSSVCSYRSVRCWEGKWREASGMAPPPSAPTPSRGSPENEWEIERSGHRKRS